MSYDPPSGDVANFSFVTESAYVPPDGDAADLSFLSESSGAATLGITAAGLGSHGRAGAGAATLAPVQGAGVGTFEAFGAGPNDAIGADLNLGEFGAYAIPSADDVELRFGPQAGEPGYVAEVEIVARLRLRGTASVRTQDAVFVAGRLRLRGALQATAFTSVSLTGRLKLRANIPVRYREVVRLRPNFVAPWGASRVLDITTRADFGVFVDGDVTRVAAWGPGAKVDSRNAYPWGQANGRGREVRVPWGMFELRPSNESHVLWVRSTVSDREARAPWGFYEAYRALDRHAPWGASAKSERHVRVPWGASVAVEPRTVTGRFGQAVARSLEQYIPWGRYSRPLNPGWGIVPPNGPVLIPGETILVPTRQAYIVQNDISLYRVDDNTDIPAFSMSLGIDAESFAWSFGATIPGTAQAAVEPGLSGDPVELAALINGMEFRVIVEKVDRERGFNSNRLKISGRSKTALLAAPYSSVLTLGNVSSMTAQQLVGDALSLNGVPLPWTVQWNITDWLVPAGVWSFRGTRIEAISRIAAAAGAYLRPDPMDQEIAVLARYPVVPWEWGTVTPDFELPAAVVTREGIEWQELPDYNAVYVSGESAGVLGYVRKTGTAGDVYAEMVTDALNTHVDVARQRGISILGATGRKANVTLRLPVLPTIGVIEPGRFVRYVDGPTERTGIVRSSQVQIDYPNVFQTLGVETHVS